MNNLPILILSVASSTILAQYNAPSPVVTSAPLHIFESSKFSQNYPSDNSAPVPIPIHQTASLPTQFTQSYALPIVPSQYQHVNNNHYNNNNAHRNNYYQQPQYPSYHHLQQQQHQQSQLGYTNINTIGTPYQMYTPQQPAPLPTLPAPLFAGGFHSSQPAFVSQQQQPQPWRPAPTQQIHHTIRTRPQTAYAPINTQLLGNLPAANSVYGSPIDPSSSGSSSLPEKTTRYTTPSPIDDTWEALEASVDADLKDSTK